MARSCNVMAWHIAFCLLQGIDLALTQYALDRHATEILPGSCLMWQHFGFSGLVILKILTVLAWLILWKYRPPRWFFVLCTVAFLGIVFSDIGWLLYHAVQ